MLLFIEFNKILAIDLTEMNLNKVPDYQYEYINLTVIDLRLNPQLKSSKLMIFSV